MNAPLDQLLNNQFDCICGKHHVVPVRGLYYAQAIHTRIPQLLHEYGFGPHLGLLADTRTW
ncbi:MAG: hypothetical protein ABR497_08985, partial [Kiritimatiellia bacterium]